MIIEQSALEDLAPTGRTAIALAAAAVHLYDSDLAERGRDLQVDPSVGPPSGDRPGSRLDLIMDQVALPLTVVQQSAGAYRLCLAAGAAQGSVPVRVVRRSDDAVELVVGRRRGCARVTAHQDGCRVEVAGQIVRIARRACPQVLAPFPAVVTAECVAVGDLVRAGDPLVVLESMKLETVVRAPADGRVGQLWVHPGAHVAAGHPLLTVEPADASGAPPADPAAWGLALLDDLAGPAAGAPDVPALTDVLLGYDASAVDARISLARHLASRGERAVAREVEVLEVFADLLALAPAAPLHRAGRTRCHGIEPTTGPRTERPAALTALLRRYGVAEAAGCPGAVEYRLEVARARCGGLSETIVLALLEAWHGMPRPERTDRVERALVRLARAGGAPRRVADLARALVLEDVPASPAGPAGRGCRQAEDTWGWEQFRMSALAESGGVRLYRCIEARNGTDTRLLAVVDVAEDPRDGELTAAVDRCLLAVRGHSTRTADGLLGPPVTHLWVRVSHAVQGSAPALRRVRDELPVLAEGVDLAALLIAPSPAGRPWRGVLLRCPPGGLVSAHDLSEPPGPVPPLDGRARSVRAAHRRGLPDPFELGEWLAGPEGEFCEFDLDARGELRPARRPPGEHQAGLVVGLVRTPTGLHPGGVRRVLLCGDPTRALGAVAEPECIRIEAALDLAEREGLPVEWFALSAGARISMASGTENMDWVARVLRRIITFTQAGGEINVVVAGINVGAQPYWNAEATMLMHTRGILVMTPQSAMVLTGKRSLDYSGGVSAADERGIGGYDRVMGPNGQAQYGAANLAEAVGIVMAHYDYTYVVPGEAGPRRAHSDDPVSRDVTSCPHVLASSPFLTVGDILSCETNPDRKQPFDIRTVIRAVADQDCRPLERWRDMADAQTAVVMDARIAGHAVCMIGVESHPLARSGPVPHDGPRLLTSGTLFPRSSKKVARAINAASGNRPVVVLANLAGFDGSPDSMRQLQLEYGAEIGRAVVNFAGPIVFCVVSRYHGGAFVVFSKQLNPGLTVLAVRGARASVIGGAPAAHVVFAGEVARRRDDDDRVSALRRDLEAATPSQRPPLQIELAAVRDKGGAEQAAAVASEFDRVHDVDRAVGVGSVDAVIEASELRPRIAAALVKAGRGASSRHR